ncbi:thioether cross-link-forming SCIFF peptide maturase [Peptoniphilus sp. oral taxon 386]|uniref:thioether cross-link-forming SCIFF peptide maturase n=1 Tax=Peptoniphilus sp. oral taxon 386 TaxID=652713 RepID=UPI0001DA9C84|nr:thioether cross-link-forming SCIFF peptide maturase [Peptoniphilus sp. oral taxon 386]EFI42246.1 six-Cys-in-45 modification radical SAM protein [Peptoniphilus sp. oral taxon 386 str. F0131]
MGSIHKFFLNDKYIVLDIASGSVHVVDEIIYDLIGDFLSLDESELYKKYALKYDYESIREAISEINALKEDEVLFTEDKRLFKPIYNPDNIVKAMCLHVAHDCNLRCKYCFASQGDFNGKRLLMDEETGKKALDFILKNSGNRKNLEVDFFGGEPLMNFELVKKLVDYGRNEEKKYNKHFRFTITTNGVLLRDDVIDYINENMDNVVLSLDGRKCVNDYMRPTISKKGSYDIIVPKFKKLVDKRGDKDYYIRGTFTNENLDFSQDLMEYYNLGFKKTSIEPVVTDEKEEYAIREEHLEKILNEYEKMSKDYIEIRKKDPDFKFFHFMIDLTQGPCIIKRTVGCGAGSEYVAVTPEGDIYPCHQFVGEEQFKLGNVDEGILNTELRDNFKCSNVFTKEDCYECWARYYCSGGCHANAYYANNDLKKPYKIGCEMEKKRIECAISILANE